MCTEGGPKEFRTSYVNWALRPQSQRVSVAQQAIAVRPTIVSVSPNSASQTTAVNTPTAAAAASAAPLNPAAAEFTPRQATVAAGHTVYMPRHEYINFAIYHECPRHR